MDETVNDQETNAQQRVSIPGIVLLAALLVVAYPLSAGPAIWLVKNFTDAPLYQYHVLRTTIYAPLNLVFEKTGGHPRWFKSYQAYWWSD